MEISREEVAVAIRELLDRVRELEDGGPQETVTISIEGSDLVLVSQVQAR